MPITDIDVVNIALAQIADNVQISSFADGTPAANAAVVLYVQIVDMLLRDMAPEFAREVSPLVPTGLAPTTPFAFSYIYPADCIALRQVLPAAPSANDPQPVRWSVQPTIIGGIPVKAIMSNQASATAVYTTSSVVSGQWDSLFLEAVVRTLASELSMPIAGRPDFARQKQTEAGQIIASDAGRDS